MQNTVKIFKNINIQLLNCNLFYVNNDIAIFVDRPYLFYLHLCHLRHKEVTTHDKTTRGHGRRQYSASLRNPHRLKCRYSDKRTNFIQTYTLISTLRPVLSKDQSSAPLRTLSQPGIWRFWFSGRRHSWKFAMQVRGRHLFSDPSQ